MPPSDHRRPPLPTPVCHRAVDARDPRFDGVFFVAIITTRIYCRPICPSRRASSTNRRFFRSAAAAERCGFRPCARCRPELAPGKALVDAVSRLACQAAERIAAGALNGRTVGSLAADLHVSERHLRRALKRETGVSPVELAQTHRLLLAKRLLADTSLDLSRVAFASGFQSLRRFNVAVRERYRMTPTAIRRAAASRGRGVSPEPGERLELTLAYRPPFAWDRIVSCLARNATPGVEVAGDGRYGRTVRVEGRNGVVLAEDLPSAKALKIEISESLVPVLMPLLARLRRLFDLDAVPTLIDAHLTEAGLGLRVQACPGLRVPGAFDGFEAALLAVLEGARGSCGADRELAGRVVRALGEPLSSGVPSLDWVVPTPGRVADAGRESLTDLGVPAGRAAILVELGRRMEEGRLRLDPDGDLVETGRALMEIAGIGERIATRILMRALHWPDAFSALDRSLQRSTGVASARDILDRAEAWRPWRAYAAMHIDEP